MKWIAKYMTAMQALLLLSLGISKPSSAAIPSDPAEGSEWAAAVSAGTPEALQRFISQFPRSERLGDALDLIIQQEIAARSVLVDTGTEVQLAQRGPPEVLEHELDPGTGKDIQDLLDDGGALAPY